MLTVETIETLGGLRAREAPWRVLHWRAPSADAHNSPEWLAAWLGSTWRDGAFTVRFVWDDGELVGVLPLVHDVGGVLWCSGTHVTPGDASARPDVLVEDGREGDVLAALAGDFMRCRLRDSVVLRRVPAAAPLVEELERALAPHGYRASLRAETSTRVADLTGGWDAWWGSREPDFREEMRRKRQGLERLGEVRRALVDGVDGVDRAVATIRDIDRHSWREPNGHARGAGEDGEAFVESLVRGLAAAGMLRAYFLSFNGAQVAYMLCSRVHETMCVLRSRFRADAGPLSAAAVLLGHVLEHAVEEGWRRLEMPGAPESWAEKVATDEGRAVTACLFPRGRVRCRLCHVVDARVKPAVRRAMPPLARSGSRAHEDV